MQKDYIDLESIILKGLEAYLFFQGLTFYNIHVGTLVANIHVEKKPCSCPPGDTIFFRFVKTENC
jgi:hypothetical protein